MKIITLLPIIIILITAGCTSNITTNAIIQPLIKESTEKTIVYFCPQDPCEDILIQYINNSEKSIHCALFDIDLENTLTALSEKSKKIDVKIVIDDNNWDEKMGGKGIIQDTKSQLSHNKFCIFDSNIVWTGSFNPTHNGAYKNNNNVII